MAFGPNKYIMKYSIVLATYNGSKYIKQQLDSFKNQTRIPDEIIICDDGSSDNTITIIESYIKENSELNIILYKNEYNLGYSANFYKAANLSTGDVIFFSDQDDIWNKDKILKVSAYFENYANIGALLCNYTLIDENSNFINNKKGYAFFKRAFGLYKFSDLVKTFSCGGLNLAVRKEYIHKYSQYILDRNLSHDVPLGIILSSIKKLYFLDEVLVYHRVHNNNVTRPSNSLSDRILNYKKQLKSTYHKHNWLQECKQSIYDNLTDQEKKWYDTELIFYKESHSALKEKNIFKTITLLFKSSPYINKQIAIYNVFAAFMMKFAKNEE